MKKKGSVLLFFLAGATFFNPLLAHCLKISCDPTLSYAMGQELAVITRRMGQLNNAMNSLAKDTELQTKILLKENIEWMRMRARMRIRVFSHMRENYNTSRVKRMEALNLDVMMLQGQLEDLMKHLTKKIK